MHFADFPCLQPVLFRLQRVARHDYKYTELLTNYLFRLYNAEHFGTKYCYKPRFLRQRLIHKVKKSLQENHRQKINEEKSRRNNEKERIA